MNKISKICLPKINFNFLLSVILIIIALVPSLINSNMVVQSFFQSEMDLRKIEIKNQGLILADKLARSAYISSDKKDINIDANIDTLADIFSGRIVIVNSDFSIIRDTFNISNGKKNISDEIIRCFNGEETLKLNIKKGYIVYAIPVYTDNNTKIDGAVIITSSTESVANILNNTKEKSLVFFIMLSFIVILVSLVVARLVSAPVYRLRNETQSIVDGNLDYKLNVNDYNITNDISNNINIALEKFIQMNKSRDEFVANVSHELKTPITSIRVLADSLMCMQDAPIELYKEFMNDISDEIDREANIIEDLLTLVRLDKSNLELNIVEVDINTLLETTLKRLRPIASKRNIEITLETNREVRAEIDETKFTLAISNLVENAIKYNVDDGYVKVHLDADHKFFYIKVEDCGIGIAQEAQDKVFDRFYRVDKARAREAGGTGLGLAITKNVILRHNGTIKLNSKEGEGSTFLIRVPLNYVYKE